MATRIHILLAAVLALGGAIAHPSVTEAECGPPLPANDIRDYIGVAFTATVADVTDEVDAPMADAAPFNWKVVLDVDRVYRGTVEETLHWNGWGAGCSGIRPAMLKKGQRLFVSMDRLDPEGMRAPGYFTLIWREDDDDWRFFKKALSYGSLDGRFPPEANNASNLRQMRKAVGALNRQFYDPVPRQDRAIDALGGRLDAVEVTDLLGGWVDGTGAEVDGPAYLDVTQMRVFIEEDDLVALFRVDAGPTDAPPSPDVAFTLFLDTDADGEADSELTTYADGDAWAATLHDAGSTASKSPTEGVTSVVNEFGVGASVDLALLGPVEDLRFVGQAAENGVFDNVPDDPDAWWSLLAEW